MIVVENLYKIFGKKTKRALELVEEGYSKDEILEKTGCTVGVNNATFEVKKGEVFVVMGLSGSGKSTLLRCFNRLIEPTVGKISINEFDVTKADVEELREIRRSKMSMVFQHFGLLPHRTVINNVAFGLEIQGVKESVRLEKAQKVIETVGLGGYEHQMTHQLSGGMQQRVGLARALTTDPEILLMDEAFSALDPLIKSNMQDELLDLQEKVRKTIIFITHDLDEALKLGDRIAIMKDGKIVQIGTPERILTDPANDYVAAFVENVFRGKIITASSVMFKHPEVLRISKHGPKYALRIMREKGLNALPVVDSEKTFLGFVMDEDVAKLASKDAPNLKEALVEESASTLADVPVRDILPLFINRETPVAVVNENNQLQGVIAHSSIVGEIIGKHPEEVEEISTKGEIK